MEVVSVEQRDGFEIRMTTDKQNGFVNAIPMAYMNGLYVGDERFAKMLVDRGIKPELRDGNQNVCSVGFCAAEQKWYGWSHRAIFGFGIGSVAAEGDCCTSSGFTAEYEAEHPERVISVPVGFEAKTLDDAKRMALAYAESVG